MSKEGSSTNTHHGEMSWTARFIVFIGVPVLFGFGGFAISYLQAFTDPLHKIDITNDFVYPAALAMLVVTVVGFRTGGFRRGIGQKPQPAMNLTASSTKKKQ